MKKILLIGIFIIKNGFALKIDAEKPLQIDMNPGVATADNKNKVITLDGHILITKGSMVIHAKKAIVSQFIDNNSQEYRILDLYGSPVDFKQMQDNGNKIVGQANVFNYNTKTNLAQLTRHAKLKIINADKTSNTISSQKITYNTQTEVYSALGDKNSTGRITIILDQK